MTLKRLLIGVSLLPALAGCVSDGTPAEAEASLAPLNSQSAFGYESPDWGTPFWERLTEKLERARASSATTAPGNEDSARVARADAADSLNPSPHSESMTPYGGTPAIAVPVASAASPAGPGSSAAANGSELHSSIALAWQGAGSVPPAVNSLGTRLSQAGFVVTLPPALMDAVGTAPDCDELTRPACLATLARYPAPRLLIVAEPAANGQLDLTTFDTQFGARYRSTTVAADNASADTLAALVSAAQRRIAVAPWFTRSFSAKDGDYYLSAGAASGLQVGDRLSVHGDGELVRGPNGQPVVWQPGARRGQVEITELLGADTSRARPIDGVKVAPGDLLVAPGSP